MRNRYFLDTEFIDDGCSIELISIAIVSDDGREYYGVSNECNHDRAGEWVRENVLPLLPDRSMWKSREQIRQDIQNFIREDDVEFWTYNGACDWVAFYQLWGTMLDMPGKFFSRCRELKQLRDEFPQVPRPDSLLQHDALHDARWNRDLFNTLIAERFRQQFPTDCCIEVFTDANNQPRFRIRHRNFQILATSEAYSSKAACMDTVTALSINHRFHVKDIQ